MGMKQASLKLTTLIMTLSTVLCSCTINNPVPDVKGKTKLQETYKNLTSKYCYSIDSCPSIGEGKLLIIPVWFSDSSTYITNSKKQNVVDDLSTAYFGSNNETGWRSVKTYYEELSSNKVTLNGTVSDWYSCGKSSSYYATDDNYASRTISLVNSATDWYFQSTKENRKNYDADGNGLLDGVVLIYGAPDCNASGMKTATNFWAYTYWASNNVASVSSPVPKSFFWASYDFMYSKSTALVRAGTNYGSGDNDYCSIDTHTFIHEMGHMFGLEDYYDYSGNYHPAAAFSMQDYNVGSHDPYSAMALGWADPYIATKSETITIGTFQKTRDLVILTPKWNSLNSPFDEYILLELYSATGLNEFDCEHSYLKTYPKGPKTVGIRVWHVDARLCSITGQSPTGNPFVGTASHTNLCHAMSNTYYKKSVEDYISPYGSTYADYNLLQLIRKSDDSYRPTSGLSNDSLFTNGDNFSMSSSKNQFKNVGLLNSGIELGWSFSVAVFGNDNNATAKITIVKN